MGTTKKGYLDTPSTGHIRAHKEAEVPDTFSATIDFEASHFIGKKGKAMIAALLGTIIEYYDYALYGYMASMLSQRFFPGTDPTVSFLKSLLVYALGFIARPFGSYIFSYIGDRYGRKYALRWNIIGIALPTVLIGCIPSYEEWGFFAIGLLCICRMAQGMFISAESDGIDIFIYETLSKSRACLANSLNWISGSLGVALASFFAGIALGPKVATWAWRLPFFFAGVLCLITLWYRKNLIESHDYMLHKTNEPAFEAGFNYWDAIKKNKLKIFLAMLLQGSAGGIMCFFFTFWNNYLHTVHHLSSASGACFKASFIVLFSAALAPVWGYIADRVGILKTIRLAALLCIMMIAANGVVLHYFNSAPSLLMLATACTVKLFCIPAYVLMVKVFNVGERYRCRGLSHVFGSIIFASTTPAISTFLWQKTRFITAPLFYCSLLVLMGLATTVFFKKDLEAAEAVESIVDPEEEESDEDMD